MSSFRTLLVIGDNHQELVKKYSGDTKVEPYVLYKKQDSELLKNKEILYLQKCISECNNNPELQSAYQTMLDDITPMDSETYFRYLTMENIIDENGDALTDENPNAYYQYEKCYDERIRKDQNDEAVFSNPFILKDGTKAYSAHVGEIDWGKNHMYNVEIYQKAWEICVNKREPITDEEKLIKDNLAHLTQNYFKNFKNVDEYIKHSCSFWTYGVIVNDTFECGEKYDSIEWTTTFFDKFIKPLSDDTLITIYEIKLLD